MKILWFELALFFVFCAATSASKEVDLEDVRQVAAESLAEFDSVLALENELLAKGLTVNRGSSAHLHARMVQSSSSATREAALNGFKIVSASKKMAEKFSWSSEEARERLSSISLAETDLKNSCPEVITCPASETLKYRPIDGSCHNIRNPDWGKSNTPFQRLLSNAYSDGVWGPRKASDGSVLDSPRLISTKFIKPLGDNEEAYTLMLMTWGQFTTHDLTKASAYTSTNGQTPQCCDSATGGDLPPNQLHPYCLPIAIPANDPVYQQYNQTCMTFVRSQVGGDYQCTMGHAEQLNGNTHWLDGSTVYGSDEATMMSVRSGQSGLLKTTASVEGKEMLPKLPSCSDKTCYYAGDVRAQENPQLAVTHTLMMREHNRLARELKRINPHWDDETLFQEARRILIAQIQHVTYNEYLPAMLGDGAMNDYNLKTAPMGTFAQIVSDEDPSIWNEFAAAVYRVGHSQVQGSLTLYDSDDKPNNDQSFTLSDYFFDATHLPDPGFFDNALRGLTKMLPNKVNPGYTRELTSRLFKGSKPYGLDLVALNVQRGREHGIPDYNSMRVFCGLPKATSFDDLAGEMDGPTLDSLKQTYRSVDDIDLYIGCLAEASLPVNGSLLGATGLCVIARQFASTKNNDRFFYDVGGQPSSFSLAQLDEIRKSSLARIMCDNNDGTVATIQPMAFKAPTASNTKVSCSAIPSVKLEPWKVAGPPGNRASSTSNSLVKWAVALSALKLTLFFYSV